MGTGLIIIIILVSLIFSAFFSGMEIAFVASNRLRIELEKKQGEMPARIVSFLTQNPAQYIATMLVGNNVALVFYGMFMAKLLEPQIMRFFDSSFSVMIIQTVISTILILITAEFLPKTIFRNNPNTALNLFAIPIIVFYVFLYPIAWFSKGLSDFLIKAMFKKNPQTAPKKVAFGRVDLTNYLQEAQAQKNKDPEIEHQIKIFKNALDFSKVKLRECIVPRNEIIALEIKQTIDELSKRFIKTGFSKIVIYNESIDNIVGYVHSSNLFKRPKTIREILTQFPIVPESMPANKLLKIFIQNQKNIALVVDEYGGTAGIVTLEDILEEIFGEIEDEHDNVELVEKEISKNEYTFSARLEIDYINEKYELGIPESHEYETLAGFIFFHHGNIPSPKETISIGNLFITILETSQTKIELINIKLLDQ